MSPIFRCSELDRLIECPGSAWLPREDRSYGEGAAWGNMVHSWLETGEYPEGRDGELLKKRVTKSNTDRDKLWPEGEHEVALAFNLLSETVVRYPNPPLLPGTTRKQNVDAWKQSFSNEWFTGSLDFVGELLDSWWIDDLKTGRDVTWGKYMWQQTSYAIMWSKYKYGDYISGRSTVTHWPRYPVARPPNRLGSVLDGTWLRNSLDRLRQLRVDILSRSPEKLLTGEHCNFCPSSGACPKLSEG